MDLQHLRASDGTGEAVLAHIQSVRNPGSTVLDLDNVDNWNSKAVVVTGTPNANGFINAAGMKVMYGHLNAGDFIIDGYAPGYVDNGNQTTEVAIVKMTTSWADALVSLLGNSLQDTGFLKTTSLDHFYKPSEVMLPNFVASGGIVAISAGLIGTFSNIVFYIGGLRYAKTGVANKTYTASKDTYVDIDATGTVYYTEVANGATSGFALTAGRIRIAKVVTSGAAITSISQTGFDAMNYPLYPQNLATQTLTHIRYQLTSSIGTPANGLVLPLNNKVYDSLGEWNPTNYRFTATKPGLYQMTARLWWGSAGSGSTESAEIGIRKNGGSQILGSDRTAGNGTGSQLSRPLATGSVYLEAGDYIDVINNSTNGVRDISSGYWTFIEIHRIG